MEKGIIPIGGICDAQGNYFQCGLWGGFCPHIKDGENHQNECPHNQLKH